MPVLINLHCRDHHLFTRNDGEAASVSSDLNSSDVVDIGLINNMPDSALISTERQLFDLLNRAAGKLVVRLHFFAMEATPRSDWGREYVRRYYLGMDDLLNNRLDGMIITGAEPKTANLKDEPYWNSFRQIIDWASENTLSTACSCLAVHGAVLHLDGIERHQLTEKCLGVFLQTKIADHPLMLNVPPTLRTPHSRWNEVREVSLLESGYTILSKSPETGVDTFVKRRGKSLLVCFQGHPEYEAQSLLGEYRRDIARFLKHESESYPSMPKYYFGREAERELLVYQTQARSCRRPEVISSFPADKLAKDLKATWHSAARGIYRNWILYMAARKTREAAPSAIYNH